MRYLNPKFFNIRLRLIIIYFPAIILTSCNGRYDKQFYGTYENNDTNRFVFFGISFYENNKYSFYSSTCFGHIQDSGNFILTNDTIFFHSFNLPLPDTSVRKVKNLNKINFRYQAGKILYIRHLKPLNKAFYFDTILIGEKKN